MLGRGARLKCTPTQAELRTIIVFRQCVAQLEYQQGLSRACALQVAALISGSSLARSCCQTAAKLSKTTLHLRRLC